MALLNLAFSYLYRWFALTFGRPMERLLILLWKSCLFNFNRRTLEWHLIHLSDGLIGRVVPRVGFDRFGWLQIILQPWVLGALNEAEFWSSGDGSLLDHRKNGGTFFIAACIATMLALASLAAPWVWVMRDAQQYAARPISLLKTRRGWHWTDRHWCCLLCILRTRLHDLTEGHFYRQIVNALARSGLQVISFNKGRRSQRFGKLYHALVESRLLRTLLKWLWHT